MLIGDEVDVVDVDVAEAYECKPRRGCTEEVDFVDRDDGGREVRVGF
jgi:hypothetical protein